MPSPLYTGIDIGADAVKVVSLRRRDTAYQVTGAGLAPVPPDLPDGAEGGQVLGGLLARLVRSQRISIGRPVLGLGGRGSLIRYLSLPVVPSWKLGMLVSYEVEEHAGAATEVAYDYRILDLPQFEEGQFAVMLAQAHADAVDQHLAICRRGVRRHAEVDMRCVALFNLYAASPQCDDDTVTLILDIGAEETGMSLQKGQSLYFARSVTGGGRRFTSRIQRAMSISSDAAEELKLTSGGLTVEEPGDELSLVDPTRNQVAGACRAEAGVLASALHSSLVFFRNQVGAGGPRRAGAPPSQDDPYRPQRLLLTGGGAQLPGLGDFLSERFRCPWEPLRTQEAFARLDGSAAVAFEEDDRDRFAAAAGLALARARPRGIPLNLLGPSEKARRRFRARTVYLILSAVAAAAALVLATLSNYRSLAVERKRDKEWRLAVTQATAGQDQVKNARSRNARLNTMVRALERRKTSTRDLLRCLDVLRVHTPEEFFYTHLTTSELAAPLESTAARPTRPRGRGTSPETEEDAEQDGNAEEEPEPEPLRFVEVEGYCLEGERTVASAKVTELAEHLEASAPSVFVEVSQIAGRPTDTPEEVAAYYQGRGEVHRLPRPGPAFYFKLRCYLADWR